MENAATTTARDTTTAAIARDEERKRGVVIDDRGFANTSISITDYDSFELEEPEDVD